MTNYLVLNCLYKLELTKNNDHDKIFVKFRKNDFETKYVLFSGWDIYDDLCVLQKKYFARSDSVSR